MKFFGLVGVPIPILRGSRFLAECHVSINSALCDSRIFLQFSSILCAFLQGNPGSRGLPGADGRAGAMVRCLLLIFWEGI